MNNIDKISVVGIGRLGICLALNLERNGYDVIGIDIDPSYVNSINNKSYESSEPHVNDLLKRSKNFMASTNLKDCLTNDIIFIVVPTLSLNNGKYDSQCIDRIVNELITFGVQSTKKYLVISSTVDPCYCDKIYSMIKQYNYEVVYNPEFIAQGSVIKDQQSPDMILIGHVSEEAGNLVDNIYKQMCINDFTTCKMGLTEAEITKIALNCFITTKIAYANMVGDVAVKLGLNPDSILNAIGNDSRIGTKCLKYGFGFGGPCFPRDNRAFGTFCEENGIYPHVSYATDKSNMSHLIYQIKDYVAKNPNKKIPVTLESITYKLGTDIIEESQRLKFAEELQRIGYTVIIKETESVIKKLKKQYGDKFIYQLQ